MFLTVESWDSFAGMTGAMLAYERGIEHAVHALRAGNPAVAEHLLLAALEVAVERDPEGAGTEAEPLGPAAVLARLTASPATAVADRVAG